MKQNGNFYWHTFADGYRVCVKGFSAAELKRMVYTHGPLVSKDLA